jgi:hypothetical protein
MEIPHVRREVQLMNLLFLAILVLLIALACLAGHLARSDWVLRNWAEEEGYRILQKRYRLFFRGPFFWRANDECQTVYRVTVEDKVGRVRSGWVCCGSWWLGLWSDQAEVRWDEAPTKAGRAVKILRGRPPGDRATAVEAPRFRSRLDACDPR